MSAEDKAKNKIEELKGTAKKKIGEATDTEQLEAEGKAKETKENLKQAGEKIKDAFTDGKDEK
ncbi:CsbD family protein [Saccharopolyspora sp. NPDC050389]|uniref:CsbD family protein n=1 Tax=Saccharopolyspora sp. NPDC050389 TaxID=3155516 RepID=UPI0033F9DA57